MTGLDLNENIAAICLAILADRPMSVELAFEIIADPTANRVKRRKVTASVEELENLRNLGMTMKEIGEIFGTGESSICHILKRHRGEEN